MTTKSTRRAALAGLASLPALSASALAANDPDANLVEMGRRLEVYYKQWLEIKRVADLLGDEAAIRAHVRAGIPDDRDRRPGETKIWLDHLGVLQTEVGFDTADEKLNAIYFPIDALAKEIFKAPCHTLAGLRAKTLCNLITSSHLWDKNIDDLDYIERATRQLIAATCALTGLSEPVFEESPDVLITDEDKAIGEAAKQRAVAAADPSNDRLLQLVRRYEAECSECSNSATLHGDEIDAHFEATASATQKQIIDEQPPATSAEGAVAAIVHVMNDYDFFADRRTTQGEQMLWLLLRGARDYIVAAASNGDIEMNVKKMIPVIQATA
jgi:hypothetical protein